jgi:hypothetical protein
MKDLPHTYIVVHPGYRVRVDMEDLEKIASRKWRVTKGPGGKLRVVTSMRTLKGVRSISLGRFLMNPPEGMQVYPRRHRDELNYCKSNLIVCTTKDRQHLLPKTIHSKTSIYRGVSRNKSGLWRAQIEVNGQSYNLGEFEREDDAAEAYNEAALKYFGPLCYQNRVGRRRLKSA